MGSNWNSDEESRNQAVKATDSTHDEEGVYRCTRPHKRKPRELLRIVIYLTGRVFDTSS